MSGTARAPSGPWGRLKSVPLDPLESIGLLSKGDKRLLECKFQEHYYNTIVARYLRFCASSGGGDHLEQQFASLSLVQEHQSAHNPSRPSDTVDVGVGVGVSAADGKERELGVIMAAMRKLREGIVASKRVDEFAVQVYFFCIRAAILVKHVESYHPALLYLLRTIHLHRALSPSELQEFGAYLVLDLACRQRDYAQAYEVRHAHRIHERRTDAIVRAMVHDDYQLFWHIKGNVDGYRAKIMEQAERGMRIVALKCLGRTYFTVDQAFLTRVTATEWKQLKTDYGVGWELDGEKVIIRKPKAH
ncbi:MAG: hypothetical protein M1838_004638 [Thelocarpon superellum]|nr:MAG: hypothetical protein M1838_004638 [Thelocarpon superellum]